MIFLALKSPIIRSYTVYLYSSSQPYICVLVSVCSSVCMWLCVVECVRLCSWMCVFATICLQHTCIAGCVHVCWSLKLNNLQHVVRTKWSGVGRVHDVVRTCTWSGVDVYIIWCGRLHDLVWTCTDLVWTCTWSGVDIYMIWCGRVHDVALTTFFSSILCVHDVALATFSFPFLCVH
jgi:hypothetical protein